MKLLILQHIGATLFAILATVLCAWLITQTPRVKLWLESLLYAPRLIWLALTRNLPGQCFANIAEGTHENGLITKKADAAISTRYLLVKFGSDDDHIALNGATDNPLGAVTDEAEAAEDLVNVQLLGCAGGTVKLVAAEAIDAGELVYTAASGKVQDAPTGATVFKVGRALNDAAQDGIVVVEPCFPVSVTFA